MPIRLAILDVDGVIKESPDPYSFLHRHFGTEKAGARHLSDFLAGRITYHQFAQLDAGAWRGRSVAEVKAALRANPYVSGAQELARGLKDRGIPLLLLSSGFDLHVEDVATDLDADGCECNGLIQKDGRLTGEMVVRVPWGGKGPIVRDMLRRWQVDPAQCLTVGDSDADLPAFQEVAYAVAVRPRSPRVSEAAQLTLPDLHGILEFIDSI
ncbi:MAG TPA: HAD-IB family phosphatase [Caldilineae bacterium]|nr:HAD-IB family phosphatase [Caldilineae bacterium]